MSSTTPNAPRNTRRQTAPKKSAPKIAVTAPTPVTTPRIKRKPKKTNPTSNMQKVPVAMAPKPRILPTPRVNRRQNGSVNIKHTELVQDVRATMTTITHPLTGAQVRASSGFEVTPFSVNPGIDIARWLAAEAPGFDKWNANSIRYFYVPTCSTETAGDVFLALDPDSHDQPPTDQYQMMAMKRSTRCVPWQTCSLDVRPSRDARDRKSVV